MKRLSFTLSRANILLLFLCLIMLVAILVMNASDNGLSEKYESSVNALSTEDSSLIILRNTYEEIVIAESHYRAYLAGFDTLERAQFRARMSRVVSNLEQLSVKNNSLEDTLQSKIARKLRIAETIALLKGQADSLLMQTYSKEEKGELRNEQLLRLDKIPVSLIEKNLLHSVDTVKQVAVSQKQGFLSRLFGRKKDSTLVQYNKGQLKQNSEADTLRSGNAQSMPYNTLAEEIKQFYQDKINRQLALRQKVDQHERSLTAANLSLLGGISNAIRNLLTAAEEAELEGNKRAANYLLTYKAHKNNILLGSFLLILLIVVLLIGSTFRINKYEKEILLAKSKAEKMAQIKTRFLNNMSHEIRVPLTSIMGFAEQLAQPDVQKDVPKYIEAIRGSSEHLLSTVNDILDFSKLEAGKLKLTKENFSLHKTLEEVVFNLSVLAEKKSLSLQLKADFDRNLQLKGDVFRLKQILYNFISNAIKFTDQGTIEVKATVQQPSTSEAEVTISVKDAGIGIAKDQLEFIFEEFAQIEQSKSSGKHAAARGTGLGLPICKMLAELQSGNVSVKSEPGQGSVFTVTVPYTISTDPDLAVMSTAQKQKPADYRLLRGKKVLVLEDNEVVVMLVSFILKKHGLQYDVATDGKHAFVLFQQGNYDLVLTDINVPGISGLELISLIRQQPDTVKAFVPVITLTADITANDLRRYQEAGFDGVLKKPFKENEMISELIRVVTERTEPVAS